MDFLQNYFSSKDDKQRKSDVEVGAEATEGSVFVSESTPMEASSSSNDNKDMQEEVIKLLKAKNLDILAIKNLLEKDSRLVNCKDNYGNSVLHLAIAKVDNTKDEDILFIMYLLEKGADLKAKFEGGYTPFLYAAFKNKFGVIKLLAQFSDNDLNAQNRDGNTALHLAVLYDYLETTIVLHKLAKTHGLREDLKNENGQLTAIDLARSRNPTNTTIVSILEDKCDPKKLRAAFQHGPSYVMTSKPRGICLVLQNEEFDGDNPKKQRTGCLDAALIKETFEGLHFKVDQFFNLTAYEMFKKIKEYSKLSHKNFDCFVLCISSHGTGRSIYGKDWNTFTVKDIIKLFTGPACSSLSGKPKLFFINACRNERNTAGTGDKLYQDEGLKEIESLLSEDYFTAKDNIHQNSPMDDIFEGHATSEGFQAYREKIDDDTCVSIYFDELCKALNEFAEEMEFQQIMTLVNSGVRNRDVHVPSPINRLLKSLWFSKNQ
ncbi:caspase-3-like isoform X2 [Rhopilema esculentum]|uniref:caspase-3-like isoform X2 n=1 Tax=Rhopilema esculentum TaxID=499914 RepID=UPI0031D5AC11|eukprot:gene9226-16910_t